MTTDATWSKPSSGSRAMYEENVRLNNELREQAARLRSIAAMHVSRRDRADDVICAVCLLPFPCATATIARAGQ